MGRYGRWRHAWVGCLLQGFAGTLLLCWVAAMQPVQAQEGPIRAVDADGQGGTQALSGSVVEVKGADLEGLNVQWRGNILPTALLSASSLVYNVPHQAQPRRQHFALVDAAGVQVDTFSVLVADESLRQTWHVPGPGLDDVTLFGYRIEAGRARMILLAHGPNIEVGMQLRVTGDGATVGETHFSRLLRNDLHGIDPSTLGYPILHYATVWAEVTALPGATLAVTICKDPAADERCTRTVDYALPSRMEELDSDGDGLFDTWEECDVETDADCKDLPGADRYRKDIFLQVDWMQESNSRWNVRPHPLVFQAAQQAFARAPVLNSDGSQGITLHIDDSHAVPFAPELCFRDRGCIPTDDTRRFVEDYKAATFAADREGIYKYGLFGWRSVQNAGRCTESGNSHRASGNFFVTLGFTPLGNRADFQAGTFLHELGHVLGLRHGGDDDVLSKDNYNTIMHYGLRDGFERSSGMPMKASPSQFGGIDLRCDLDSRSTSGVYTYSHGMRRDLNEERLNEAQGVCNGMPVNWDGKTSVSSLLSQDIDNQAGHNIVRDHPDWVTIIERLRARDGFPEAKSGELPTIPDNLSVPPAPAAPSTVLQLPDPVPPVLSRNYQALPEGIDFGIALKFNDDFPCLMDISFLMKVTEATEDKITFEIAEGEGPKVQSRIQGICEVISGGQTILGGELSFRIPRDDGLSLKPLTACGSNEDSPACLYEFEYALNAFGTALGFELRQESLKLIYFIFE